jgi:hypothetical protein
MVLSPEDLGGALGVAADDVDAEREGSALIKARLRGRW